LPKYTILISLHEISGQNLKTALKSMRVIVIDDLKPSDPSVQVFQRTIRDLLG
jgi:nucleoside-triphosphatase THEP1